MTDGLMGNKTFKEYWLTKYSPWPGTRGEQYHILFENMCDTMAEYIDLKFKEQEQNMKFYDGGMR